MINHLFVAPTKNAPIRDEVLKGPLNYNMSTIFTFLCATNLARALALEGTFDFHKKLVR